MKKGENPAKIDPDDERIINALLSDARQSYRHIAAGLGLATATVAQRVRNLERQKVLLGAVPVLNFEKLGFAFCVITQVKIHQGKLALGLRRLAANPHVFGIYDHTGGTDATVLARFRDRQSLDRFLKQLQAAPHVERTETQLVLNVFKEFIRRLPDPLKGRAGSRAY
ncbi:Lrp/AsnC family transcriptional regulator [bacterium]|nr:Lrp/AsnC family transcriptional regulator [bacterium]